MNISFVLGAGFSFNAGIPIVSGISERFTQERIHENILHFPSEESAWSEFAIPADVKNGSISHDKDVLGFILQELVSTFLEENIDDNGVLNYEDFYFWSRNYLVNNINWITVVESASENYYKEYKSKLKRFDTITPKHVFSCILHLIRDLLEIRREIHSLRSDYSYFIKVISDNSNEINIFTLNHDLLLEILMENSSLNYSNGFSTSKSTLIDDDKSSLAIFDNTFDERIKIYKLHGAINQFKYEYIESSNSYKGYDYFITNDYQAKHWARDTDDQGNAIQQFNPNIDPSFITGNNKVELITTDKMYSELYKKFSDTLPKSDKLVIIGYSYNDEHINSVIEGSIKTISQIINVNPFQAFPFSHENITNINPLNDNLSI
ncbi:hypothetical protein OKW21_005821 [Catalinimonas alkaloidigena]|uniref:SIR2 family protein n=1 Tax=Catalinimonas alkaloidigena TaxID=1075417 RepID=UPI0024062A62|nr:SIR2 family protein [Catalinimonas alkaloidigena]MDF9800558.1 hypothetical protein [Catalinimonas alkaloidigena]